MTPRQPRAPAVTRGLFDYLALAVMSLGPGLSLAGRAGRVSVTLSGLNNLKFNKQIEVISCEVAVPSRYSNFNFCKKLVQTVTGDQPSSLVRSLMDATTA